MSPLFLSVSVLRSTSVAKRVVASTVLCCALGAAWAFLQPPWFRSTLTVVPATSPRGSGAASLLGSVGGLAGFDTSLMGGADSARIGAVLQSTSVTDAVIDKFDLLTRYGQRYREGARSALWTHCDVVTHPKPGIVELSCEDKDPRVAQEMAAFFGEHGNQVFRRVSASSASEEVRFLQRRVSELRQEANDAASRLREFQERYQVVDLDTQTKAVVSALASLQSQRISKQLELDYARTFSSQDEPTMRQLQSQLSVMDETLRDLEQPTLAMPEGLPKRPRRTHEATNGMFPAALAVPKLRAQFEDLYRDRKVSEATLVFALERLEAAKATEARDVSTFVVLDAPVLPTRKSRPRRLFVIATAALLGVCASSAYEWWRRGGLRILLASDPA